MTNQEYYRAAFSKVKAPEDAAERALCRRNQKKRRIPRFVPAAAALALLTTTAHAELDNGGVSNLLAPLFGCAQTELVDEIGYPIDASASANGYTITADAVIGDRYTMYIIYTLSCDSGEPVPEHAYFSGHSNSAQQGSGSGGLFTERNEDGTATIMEEWTSVSHLGRHAEVTFQDLVVWDSETETETVIARGEWTLRFALRYQDTTEKVPVKNLTITDGDGRQYTVNEVLLSALSVRLDMTAPPVSGSGDNKANMTAALRLKDGTVEPITNQNYNISGTIGKPASRAKYTGEFDAPHLLEDIEAILICDTEIPVN